MQSSIELRQQLIGIALEWEARFGVIPSITSAVAEFDASQLVGCGEAPYSNFMKDRTAVSRGFDFVHDGKKYQVKANRPSGKPGSRVTLVARPRNYEWDRLIWILYDREFRITEAWEWDRQDYESAFESISRLSPDHIRRGRRLV